MNPQTKENLQTNTTAIFARIQLDAGGFRQIDNELDFGIYFKQLILTGRCQVKHAFRRKRNDPTVRRNISIRAVSGI